MSDEQYNRQAEARVLSGLLRNPEEYWSINDVGLMPTDFGGREGRYVFSAIQSVAEDRNAPEVPLVLERLRSAGHSATEDYLSRLLEIPCSLAQAKESAQIVKGLAINRDLVNFGVKVIETAKENRADYVNSLGEIEAEFAMIRRGLPKDTNSPVISDILNELKNSDTQSGIPLQFSPSLQYITGGLIPGWLWVIGGFTSVGKSAVACNFIIDALRAKDTRVGVISTEMTKESYAIRLLSNLSGIPQRNIRERVSLGGDAITRLQEADAYLTKQNLYIYDTVSDLKSIRATATRMSKTDGLDVLLVDFIQNVGNTGDEVADARTTILGLQNLAKELRCSVVAFSQISNDMAQRQADGTAGDYYSFKGHGAIRDAADVAIMLKRDQQSESPFLECRIVKNRHEQLGKITWKMDLPTGRISEQNAEV